MASSAPAASGELRSLVRIERTTTTTTDTGDQGTPVVSTVATVWAAIDMDPGVETIALGGPQAVQRIRVRIRYRADIHPADRVIETAPPARTFEIVAPPWHDPTKRETALSCIEKVS